MVSALIRTGKQTRKMSFCASELRGEEYKTSGMYRRILDDEEAAAYKWPWSHSFRDISRLTAATWKEESALVSLESLIEGWCSG